MITAISAPGLFCFPKPFNTISKTHGSTWTFPFPHQRNEPDGQTPWENCGRAAAANLHLFRVFSLDSPSGKMWQHAHYIPFKYLENVAIYPLLPIIYIYIIVTQDFTVHTFASEFIGTWRVPSHVEVCTVPKRSAISFATTWGLSWRRAVSGTNKKTNHRGHPEFLAFPTSNSLAYFPPKKKHINSNFTTGVMIIMKSGLWGILFSGTPLYSLKKYIYIYNIYE